MKVETLQPRERAKLSFKKMKHKLGRSEESVKDVSVLFKHERNSAFPIFKETFWHVGIEFNFADIDLSIHSIDFADASVCVLPLTEESQNWWTNAKLTKNQWVPLQ